MKVHVFILYAHTNTQTHTHKAMKTLKSFYPKEGSYVFQHKLLVNGVKK